MSHVRFIKDLKTDRYFEGCQNFRNPNPEAMSWVYRKEDASQYSMSLNDTTAIALCLAALQEAYERNTFIAVEYKVVTTYKRVG